MSDLIYKMALDLLLPPEEILKLVRSAPNRYKVYSIPKQNGRGLRIIAQPTPAVKELQRWVVKNILKDYPVHPAATAYQPRSSILLNASAHKNNTYILKLDFEKFFNSITSTDFIKFLHEAACTHDIIEKAYLCQVLFWRPKGSAELILSIGAPSSPILSNILLFRFDSEINEWCVKRGINFTRYADDLTFSTNSRNLLKDAKIAVEDLLSSMKYPRLRINAQKVVYASRKSRRRITGLVVTNERNISLGRDRKRLLRAMVHRFKCGELDEREIRALQGWLSFANSIEPAFLQRLMESYGPELLAQLGGFHK